MPKQIKFQDLPARDALVLEVLLDNNIQDTNDGTKATLTSANLSFADCPVGYQKKYGLFSGSSTGLRFSNFNTTAWGNSFHVMWYGTVDSLSKIDKYLLMRGTGAAQNSIICGYVAGQFEFLSNGGHTGTDPRTGSGLTIPDTTNPHLYEYRYDGKTWSGYVDFVQVFSVARTFSLTVTSSELYLGRSDVGDSFPGKLAFRFFKRALSEMERLAYWHEYNRQLGGGSDFGAYIPQPSAYLNAVGEDTFYDVALGTKATRTAGSVTTDNLGLSNAISAPNQSWTSVSGDSFAFMKDPVSVVSIPSSNDTSGGNMSHGIYIYANRSCKLKKISTMFSSWNYSGATINGTAGTLSGSDVLFDYDLVAGNSYTIAITGNTMNYAAYSYPSLPIVGSDINVTGFIYRLIGITSVTTEYASADWKLEKNKSGVTATGINLPTASVRSILYYPASSISSAQQGMIEKAMKLGYPYLFKKRTYDQLARKAALYVTGKMTPSGLHAYSTSKAVAALSDSGSKTFDTDDRLSNGWEQYSGVKTGVTGGYWYVNSSDGYSTIYKKFGAAPSTGSVIRAKVSLTSDPYLNRGEVKITGSGSEESSAVGVVSRLYWNSSNPGRFQVSLNGTSVYSPTTSYAAGDYWIEIAVTSPTQASCRVYQSDGTTLIDSYAVTLPGSCVSMVVSQYGAVTQHRVYDVQWTAAAPAVPETTSSVYGTLTGSPARMLHGQNEIVKYAGAQAAAFAARPSAFNFGSAPFTVAVRATVTTMATVRSFVERSNASYTPSWMFRTDATDNTKAEFYVKNSSGTLSILSATGFVEANVRHSYAVDYNRDGTATFMRDGRVFSTATVATDYYADSDTNEIWIARSIDAPTRYSNFDCGDIYVGEKLSKIGHMAFHIGQFA